MGLAKGRCVIISNILFKDPDLGEMKRHIKYHNVRLVSLKKHRRYTQHILKYSLLQPYNGGHNLYFDCRDKSPR